MYIKLTKTETFLMKIGWYKFCRFIKDWIYPAYHLRNFLFHRHDIIKCPQIKPYEYTDVSYLMLCANMELIVKFIEKENPEKHICWYTDEETGEELGHKYGECEIYDIMFPEYKGKWVMDIIKEIYNFWKVEYPEYLKDDEYLLHFWCEYFSEIKSHFGYDAKIAKSMDDFPKDINWDIITKYMDKEKLFEKDYVLNKHHELQINIEKCCQKYLHLCIEIRQYLWT